MRLVIWRASAVASALLLASGCSFPAHDFTNDGARQSGGRTSSSGRGGSASSLGGGMSEAGVSGDSTTVIQVETCDNRIDDDQDGRIDCADPDCLGANWACLPPVPAGWDGPIAMATAAKASALPPCETSGGYRVLVSAAWCSKVSEAPAVCPSCAACANVENPVKDISVELGSDCSGTCPLSAASDCRVRLSDGCQRIQVAQTDLASGFSLSQLKARVAHPAISSGTCANPDTEVEGSVDAECLEPMIICRGAASGTCPSADSCVLKPLPPFNAAPCIYFRGPRNSCPDGWNALRQTVYTNVVDARGCTNCTCTPPEPAAYASEVALTISDHGSDATCAAGSPKASSGPGGCLPGLGSEASSGVVLRYFKANIAVPAKPCVSAGGKAIGAVETQEPFTICCTSL